MTVRSFAWPLVDPTEKLKNEIADLVRAALPLTSSPGEFATEWQVKYGDGCWHSVSAQMAVSAHQQGLPVRERRVGEWREAA